jgi:hypothetical protein
LFFVVVPYSCIFIYENLEYFLPDKTIAFNKWIYIGLSMVFILSGIAFYYQDYTILALMSCAFFFIIAVWRFPQILQSRNYWLYILISMIPFIMADLSQYRLKISSIISQCFPFIYWYMYISKNDGYLGRKVKPNNIYFKIDYTQKDT